MVSQRHGWTVAPSTVTDALIAREQLASTGLGHGVAIPHARLKGLKAAVASVIRTEGAAALRRARRRAGDALRLPVRSGDGDAERPRDPCRDRGNALGQVGQGTTQARRGRGLRLCHHCWLDAAWRHPTAARIDHERSPSPRSGRDHRADPPGGTAREPRPAQDLLRLVRRRRQDLRDAARRPSLEERRNRRRRGRHRDPRPGRHRGPAGGPGGPAPALARRDRHAEARPSSISTPRSRGSRR